MQFALCCSVLSTDALFAKASPFALWHARTAFPALEEEAVEMVNVQLCHRISVCKPMKRDATAGLKSWTLPLNSTETLMSG